MHIYSQRLKAKVTRPLQTQSNKWVFRARRNCPSERSDWRRLIGKAFHRRGPATLYSTVKYSTVKVLMDHSFTCKLHHTIYLSYLVIVLQTAPLPWQACNWSIQLIFRLRKDERVDRTGRLTSDYNGRFTYKPSPRPSVVGRAQKTTLVLVLVGLFHLNSQLAWFETRYW